MGGWTVVARPSSLLPVATMAEDFPVESTTKIKRDCVTPTDCPHRNNQHTSRTLSAIGFDRVDVDVNDVTTTHTHVDDRCVHKRK
jgi:hypothetical protein